MEIETTLYRVPWIERTAEFSDQAELLWSIERPYRTWEPSVGIRLGFQVPVQTDP